MKIKTSTPGYPDSSSQAIKPDKRGVRRLDLEAAPLPTLRVAAFVADLAKVHGIAHVRSEIDDFAEAVSRLSGDDKPLDATSKLLVALRKGSIIDGNQLARLMSNHLKEMLDQEASAGLRVRLEQSEARRKTLTAYRRGRLNDI